MNPTDLTYPVFEANQVLTNAHLNELFDYLDDQGRMTRANLVGIGIVCGLEVGLDATGAVVHLSKGCGITSEGYLVVEPADLDLGYVRPYTLPRDYGYAPFTTADVPPAQYSMWELLADDSAAGAVTLAGARANLPERLAVVLFVELRKDGLRNCSPNNCDDRGAEVTSTIRPLLVGVDDLDKIVAAGGADATTSVAVGAAPRLELPTLRMPRYDVPNSGPVTAEAVLHAFQAVFRDRQLVATTTAALTSLYEALKPLVVDEFTSDPFATAMARFAFLDRDPVSTSQVLFMQYYWDLFDDVVAAYNQLRRDGVDLHCSCCPPAGLFPRHLTAGTLDATASSDYRNRFVPSPAVGDCEEQSRAIRVLFRRLVALLERFSETPSDKGIRVTPSRWGDAPLSAKAIPYYYDAPGAPPLFELWDPDKTARRRANENLGYRADDYTPAAPEFVTDPLRFDLEPNNFLRVEGHLGKDVQGVLRALTSLRKSRRLPFEVVALRAGAFDDAAAVDLSLEDCRFQDLETLYETLKSELICFLVKEVQYFYGLPADPVDGEELLVPTLGVLATYAPDFRAQPATLGHRIEEELASNGGAGVIFGFAFVGEPSLLRQSFALTGAMSELATALTPDVRGLDFASVRHGYGHVVHVARVMDAARGEGVYDAPLLAERLDDVVFRCRLDPFEALGAEYLRRVRDAKQAGFLASFLERHPGVQHKAGVPVGGTFVLVYQELAAVPVAPPRRIVDVPISVVPRAFAAAAAPLVEVGAAIVDTSNRLDVLALDADQTAALRAALARFPYKSQLADDPDLQAVFEIVTGDVLVRRRPFSHAATDVYLEAVAGLANGTVIADFFLPYACCSDCPPIEYQLPRPRLRVDASKGCTNDGFAEVTLTAPGASGPLSVQVDGGDFVELAGPLGLPAGNHSLVVRDAQGGESAPLTVTIPEQLTINDPQTVDDVAEGTYTVACTVSGGTAPYTADSGRLEGGAYASDAHARNQEFRVVITDAAGCTVEQTFAAPCALPCDGAAERAGYRFWIPEPKSAAPITYTAQFRKFVVAGPNGDTYDLTDEVANSAPPNQKKLAFNKYATTVDGLLAAVNQIVADAVGSGDWLRLEYEGPGDAASAANTTGTLYVDRLSCIDFTIAIVVTSASKSLPESRLRLIYDATGTTVEDLVAEIRFHIPSFDRSSANKCLPALAPVPVCEGAAKIDLAIVPEGPLPDVSLTADAKGEDVVAFLWEVPDATPAASVGSTVKLRFAPSETVTKPVRLTAFTARGCRATLETVVDFSNPVG